MAGQGTAAKELIEDAGRLDVLVVCLGGGGLLSGCAVAARALNPDVTIIGVEPEAGNDGQQSFRTGRIVHIDTPQTIADGAQTQHLGVHTFPVIRRLVNDIVTVSDAELVSAMKFFASRMKMVVEPTGCLAAAAVFEKKIDVRDKKVGVLISGGNVDLAGRANQPQQSTESDRTRARVCILDQYREQFNRQLRAGHSGLFVPRGTAGRAQRAGVSDICTAGARCVMRP